MRHFWRVALGIVAVSVVVFAALVLLNLVNDENGGTPVVTGAGGSAVPIADVDGFSPEQIYESSADGVVLVVAAVGAGGGNLPDIPEHEGGEALGTGFVVTDDGIIITNAHVVSQNGQNASSVRVAFREGEDQSSEQVDATLVGVDQTTDIAILKIDPEGRQLTPLPLGDSSDVQIGQWVVAIGNPLGYSFSVTQGIVSGVGRNLQAPNGAVIANGIQTDAAINQGNSGGPLLDAAGNVIGVNEQIATTTGSFSGLGFAIPINTAKRVMEQIVETGEAQHAFLGIEGQTIDRTVAQLLDLPVQRGVLIARVQEGTAAAEAGLRGGDSTETIQGAPFVVGGDVITQLDGEELAGMEELASAIAQKQPGDEITLTVLRDGDTQDITVTLGERPANQ